LFFDLLGGTDPSEYHDERYRAGQESTDRTENEPKAITPFTRKECRAYESYQRECANCGKEGSHGGNEYGGHGHLHQRDNLTANTNALVMDITNQINSPTQTPLGQGL
jgi:hypothetical protein